MRLVRPYLSGLAFVAFFSQLFISSTTNAQSGYVFSQLTQPYIPLVGGTTLITANSNGTTGTGTQTLDSYVGTLSLPFAFMYNTSSYLTVYPSSNGFLTFGLAPSTTNVNPIGSTAGYAGAIAGFGGNLIGTYRVANPADPDTVASIRSETIGTAPFRVFAIEWVNFRPSNSAINGAGPAMSFQIRLHETTNLIEIHYGAFLGSPWSNGTAQVGLRGGSNTLFFNRALTSGSAWTATLQGAANNSTCAYTANTLPPDGLTFRFTPPCPQPTALSVLDLAATTVKLRWNSGSSGSSSGSTYQVEWGVTGFSPGTGNLITTADTFLNLSNLIPGTSYSYYVRRDCGSNSLSVLSGPRTFIPGQPGEDCASAIQLQVAPDQSNCVSVTVTSGQSQNGPNALCSDGLGGNTPDDDRWLKFTAPANDKKIVIQTSAGTVSDWVMEVWSGCPGSGGQLLDCSDDVVGGMPVINLCQNQYIAGATYYVRLWTYSTALTGTAGICIYEEAACPIPPPYDDCINAAFFPINPVQSCPGNELIFTTLFATPSGLGGANGAAPSCDASTTINDVWLGFNTGLTGDFTVTFSLGTATSLKAQLLFECGGGGIELMCMPNAVGTWTFTGLNPVANYVLRIWSPAGQEGSFTVCAQDLCDDATAAISGSATICSSGLAQVRFDMTGLAPWTVSYTDGSTTSNFTTSTTPYFVPVSPSVTTFYNLVSVSSPVCFGTVSGVASVSVVAPPTVTLAPFSTPVCSNTTVQLSGGSPAGGTYSGTGVSGNQFNASVAGPGTHPITYTYGFGNGCQRSATQNIQVIPGPRILSFSPSSGSVGTVVALHGSGFVNVSSVKFNTTLATVYQVGSPTSLSATVPVGATTGLISVTNANGCTTQSTSGFAVTAGSVQLTIRAFMEGLYLANGLQQNALGIPNQPNAADTLTVTIRQALPPYGLLNSQKVLVGTNGWTSAIVLPSSFLNTSCYVTIRNRNSLETWTKQPVLLQSTPLNIDFTLPGTSGLRTTANPSVSSSGNRFLNVLERPEHPE